MSALTQENHLIQLSEEIPGMTKFKLMNLKSELKRNNTELGHYNVLIDIINDKIGAKHDGYVGDEVTQRVAI